MKRLLVVLVVVIFGTVPAVAGDGPFGLNAGMSLDEVKAAVGGALKKETSQVGVWSTATVPKPSPMFETYIFMLSNKTGLCKVTAVGSDVKTGSHGIELRQQFDKMRGLLDGVYGPGKVTDQLAHGTMWKEPQYFMMSLVQKERFLISLWMSGPYKSGITNVMLKAGATSGHSGYLLLHYEFDNFVQCQAALEAEQQGVF